MSVDISMRDQDWIPWNAISKVLQSSFCAVTGGESETDFGQVLRKLAGETMMPYGIVGCCDSTDTAPIFFFLVKLPQFLKLKEWLGIQLIYYVEILLAYVEVVDHIFGLIWTELSKKTNIWSHCAKSLQYVLSIWDDWLDQAGVLALRHFTQSL